MRDRLPPHDEQAEWCLIACVLENPSILGALGGDLFYVSTCQEVIKRCKDLQESGAEINEISVAKGFANHGALFEKLAKAADDLPAASGWEYWLGLCKEFAQARAVMSLGASVTQMATAWKPGNPIDVASIISQTQQIAAQAETRTIRDAVKDSLSKLEELFTNPDSEFGLSCGFNDLDRLTKGFQPASMNVIAARPSVGKTSMAMNIAAFQAVTNKKNVAIFSLEAPESQLVTRMLCSQARVSTESISSQKCDERGFQRLMRESQALSRANMHIFDKDFTISSIYGKALSLHAREKLGLIVIDYLQLVQCPGNKEGRTQQVTQVSNQIKQLAMLLECPIIALAQLNRDVVKQGNGKRAPQLQDLRESGAIEQDADMVWMIHPTQEPNDHERFQPVDLLVRKNRHGRVGTVPLLFERSITRFTQVADEQ